MRLDVWLVEHCLAESRQKAQALILAGRVRVGASVVTKAGTAVVPEALVTVATGPEHVGRGALKLIGALAAFRLDPAGRVAIDVGASTGGFTEVLLKRGAARVYAVDVGRAQLHESLRSDPRVRVLEGINARHLSPQTVPEPCSLAVMDVSFISVIKILPALRGVLAMPSDAVVLVKPQFELTRRLVGRGGLVKDPERHRQALAAVAEGAQATLDFAVRGACASPIAGATGNREFFLHLVPGQERATSETMTAMIAQAVQP
jgi:23S rRNA (cytidine1920-2'-O)/16S rRNA (cytidine1409-2'-O)-methyltransferase